MMRGMRKTLPPLEWILWSLPLLLLGALVLVIGPQAAPAADWVFWLLGGVFLAAGGLLAQVGVIAQGVRVGLEHAGDRR